MPRGNFRSLFRYLFPSIHRRASVRFSNFRYETLPTLKVRAQSRIYAAIVKHQQNKRRKRTPGKGYPNIVTDGNRKLTDKKAATMSTSKEGSRRAKIAGYLQQANKLRQDYQARRVGAEEYQDMPGAFPNVKISRHENEELVIFPSYARPHIKKSTSLQQDLRKEGTNDEEYWRREWEIYEDMNAVVDVDLRGWIYTNLKGPMNRRHRLLLTVARQLSGIPSPDESTGYAGHSMADSNSYTARQENEMARQEVERIEKLGQQESEAAQQGRYTEKSRFDSSDGAQDDATVRVSSPGISGEDETGSAALAKRQQWNQPSDFSPEELEIANKHLLSRLRPFLTTPSANQPLTIFYYNEETSQSRTTTTNEYGHFNFRAALDFVPTHIRVLAGESLSATEHVEVSEPQGISLISDIDDTVKHSAVTAGAREIFRNTFIRDLGDLTIDGVKQWYGKMHEMGVKLHYVSNSPWQLYPVLVEYFSVAGLPPGSFHLKQYTGMLQGIFEPVAERKKGSLDRIMNDFPERRFILVGDSGEADLELYTDVALADPKRILAVFIRDVTSSSKEGLGFFNSSLRPSNHSFNSEPVTHSNGSNGPFSGTPLRSQKHRPDLPPRPQSIAPMQQHEEEDLIDLGDGFDPKTPLRSATDPISPSPLGHPVTSSSNLLPLRPSQSSNLAAAARKIPPPRPPPKPRQLSGGNATTQSSLTNASAELRASSNQRASIASIASTASAGTSGVRGKLASIYNSLPPSTISTSPRGSRASSPASRSPTTVNNNSSTSTTGAQRFGEGTLAFTNDGNRTNDRPAPALPPRRGLSSYPAAAASYATSHLWSSGGNDGGRREYSEGSVSGAVNKREEMWKRRWLRSKELLEGKGVVLKAWRVGSDVIDEAVRLVEQARRDREHDERR